MLIYPFKLLRVRSLRGKISRLQAEAAELKQITDYVPLRVAQVRTELRTAQAELDRLAPAPAAQEAHP